MSLGPIRDQGLVYDTPCSDKGLATVCVQWRPVVNTDGHYEFLSHQRPFANVRVWRQRNLTSPLMPTLNYELFHLC